MTIGWPLVDPTPFFCSFLLPACVPPVVPMKFVPGQLDRFPESQPLQKPMTLPVPYIFLSVHVCLPLSVPTPCVSFKLFFCSLSPVRFPFFLENPPTIITSLVIFLFFIPSFSPLFYNLVFPVPATISFFLLSAPSIPHILYRDYSIPRKLCW